MKNKDTPLFLQMTAFINNNVGNTVSTDDILLGNSDRFTTAVIYIYQFIKLGYIRIINNKAARNKDAIYKILKGFPKHYNLTNMRDELRRFDGLIAEAFDMKNINKITVY